MKEYYPTCRYCGKQQLPLAKYEDQKTADEAATIKCDCSRARVYQREKERKEQREKSINKLKQSIDEIAQYSSARNAALSDKARSILLECGISVIDGVASNITIKLVRLKVSFCLNANNALVIGYAYSEGGKIELQ